MFPVLQIASFAIPVAPLVLLLGVFASASLVERHAARLGLDQGSVSNMLYYGLGAGLVGARLGYVLANLDAFLRDPVSILLPNPNTLNLPVGLVVGIGIGVLYGVKAQLPLWRTLDALAPGMVAMGVVLGIAHLASGDGFGAPARLPWSVYLWDEYRHPSQVYEIVAALVILVVWWLLGASRRTATREPRAESPYDGFQFWAVIGLYAASVLLLEAFRGDSWLWQGWRVAQVLALGILALALIALRVLGQRVSSTQ